jgi:Na+-driven multidrug efflux pump
LGPVFVGNAVMLNIGDTLRAGYILTIAAMVSSIFDYLLIPGNFGFPALEVQGAAYASLLSWACSGVFFLLLGKDVHGKFRFSTTWLELCATITRWKAIARYGIPLILSRVMLPISTAVVFGMTANFGSVAIAAYTIASQIESVLMLAGIGIAIVLNTFIAQNLSAGKHDRVLSALRFSIIISMVIGVALWILFVVFGRMLGQIFTNDAAVLRACFISRQRSKLLIFLA